MQAELSVALNFIISHLYNKLPRRRVDVFREELQRGFELRFVGHWYPDEPTKGSGFRCVKLAADKVCSGAVVLLPGNLCYSYSNYSTNLLTTTFIHERHQHLNPSDTKIPPSNVSVSHVFLEVDCS